MATFSKASAVPYSTEYKVNVKLERMLKQGVSNLFNTVITLHLLLMYLSLTEVLVYVLATSKH